MAYMNWTAKLETGHQKIDEDHKALVQGLNDLHAAMKAGQGKTQVVKTLHFLRDYTVRHFSTEESLMQKHGYPGAAEHMAIHADLVKEVVGLVTKVERGETPMTISVLDFLEGWLTKHICGMDMALAEFLKGKGVAT